MKRLAWLLLSLTFVMTSARSAFAEPAWGVNCLSCHGDLQLDMLWLLGEDTTADPDESSTGALDRGLLKVYDAYRRHSKTVQTEVVGLDVGDTYAVELTRFRYPGVENSGQLDYTEDCDWAYWGSPGKYYTDPAIAYTRGSGPTTFEFIVDVGADTPNDYYDLVFAVAGRLGSGDLFYSEEHFYLRVSQMPGDFDDDSDVDGSDYTEFVACFTGSDGGPVAGACEIDDFDADGDVDCADWNLFVIAWTEPGEPPDFAQCIIQVPQPASSPHDARKNRYISVNANNAEPVALQVELTSMKRCDGDLRRACVVDADCPGICTLNQDLQCTNDTICGGYGPCMPTSPCVQHPDVGSVTRWVGVPFESVCTPLDDCSGQWFAHLADDPTYRVWTESVIHITDCRIVPVADYAVRATFEAPIFSNPLIIGTIAKPQVHYADCVGPVDPGTGEFLPADGYTNVTDVQAYLIANQGGATAPHTTWVDLHSGSVPVVPQQILNVGDLQTIKFGFLGQTYVDTPGHEDPGDCP